MSGHFDYLNITHLPHRTRYQDTTKLTYLYRNREMKSPFMGTEHANPATKNLMSSGKFPSMHYCLMGKRNGHTVQSNCNSWLRSNRNMFIV